MATRASLLVLAGGVLAVIACEGRAPPRSLRPAGAGAGAASSSAFSAIAAGPSAGSGANDNIVPDPDAPCDAGIAYHTDDPVEAAAALGLCKQAAGDDDWGLISARWAMADGSDPVDEPTFSLGHGVLNAFGQGTTPQEGERFLALSSGTARQPGHPDYESVAGFDKGYTSASPPGYPKESPSCPGVSTGETHDDVALEVIVRPPEGAASLAFDFNFFTYEWPEFVCSPFNDFFLAFLEPVVAGQADPNVSFDSVGNVVSVNNALVRACGCGNGPPCPAPPELGLIVYDCEEGPGELALTGFEGHAATSWLVTRAPVTAGQPLKLRWMIYDSGDGVLDSTVVLDNFRWLGDAASEPVTDPK